MNANAVDCTEESFTINTLETGNRLRLADVFVTINDPRQSGKVEHDLVELLAVAVNAVLAGADTDAIASIVRLH